MELQCPICSIPWYSVRCRLELPLLCSTSHAIRLRGDGRRPAPSASSENNARRMGCGLVSHGCKDHVTHLAEWLFTFVRPTFSVRYAAEGRFARCGGLKPYEGLAKLVRQTLASATFQGRASTGAEIRGALARVYWPGACRHLSRTRETRAPSELFGLRRARRPEVTIAVAD